MRTGVYSQVCYINLGKQNLSGRLILIPSGYTQKTNVINPLMFVMQ